MAVNSRMRKPISIHKLVQRAIEPATNYLVSLAEAYSFKGEVAEEAMTNARAFKQLQGKRFALLKSVDRNVAGYCLQCAEDYELGFADSLANCNDAETVAVRSTSFREAKEYREARWHTYGKNAMERALENARSVPMHELLKLSKPSP